MKDRAQKISDFNSKLRDRLEWAEIQLETGLNDDSETHILDMEDVYNELCEINNKINEMLNSLSVHIDEMTELDDEASENCLTIFCKE